jgi:hypothetical protein|tara:strand:+ start:369 stop:998 length:630 start_codon:yes stop_codon:yes gene_type:complete
MSTVHEALQHKEVSTFIGGTGTATHRGLIEGEYLGHIANTRSIVRPVRPHFQARIYNFDVIVAPENASLKYQYEDIDGSHTEITGEQFVGKKLIAKGVFKFLDPQEGDDFEGNSSENSKYFRFCETLGVMPTDTVQTIDGKETTVKVLPLLTEADMIGKPVTAVLKKTKDEWTNNKGEKMHYSWRVSYVKLWTGGNLKDMKVNPDDLPF